MMSPEKEEKTIRVVSKAIIGVLPNVTRVRGFIITDPITGKTSQKGIWAGGDIVSGEATVIRATGMGKRSAKDIHQWLTAGAK